MKSKQSDPVLMAIMSEIHKTAQKPDAGFKTVQQWSETWGFKRDRALDFLNKGIKIGTIEKKMFRVAISQKHIIRELPHYGLKKK
jgi:NOL1/NOP2/fmu family ribosome biogenesis protein